VSPVENSQIGSCYVSSEDLREKHPYLMISFFDSKMRFPDITTVIYLGRDIFSEGRGMHYFQEYTQFASADPQGRSSVIVAAEDKLMNFFDLRGASELLRLCAELQHPRDEPR